MVFDGKRKCLIDRSCQRMRTNQPRKALNSVRGSFDARRRERVESRDIVSCIALCKVALLHVSTRRYYNPNHVSCGPAGCSSFPAFSATTAMICHLRPVRVRYIRVVRSGPSSRVSVSSRKKGWQGGGGVSGPASAINAHIGRALR